MKIPIAGSILVPMSRRERESMNPIRKYALLFISSLFIVAMPGVSVSQGLNENIVKETPPKHEIRIKDSMAVSADRRPKDGLNKAASDIPAPLIKDKKTEDNREEQDQDIMEQALTLLQASQEYWVKGDVESALEMLDQAYALILDTNGEPDIARQKDDLRLLISKRILAIYSAMQTVTVGKKSEIPLITNADVEKEIRSFQGVERDFFISSYQRSYLYRPMILRELKKVGLPEELSWLPLVESGFKIAALSSARALGLWQFIPSTGYKYDLNRDDWIDERMDAEKSTRAAIAYLRELHGMFGDWLTVLAAYNCGEGRVMRVISRQHINYLDRFWDLYHQLPNETARYVPRFLATLHIIKDPARYGIDLSNGSQKPLPMSYEIVKTNKSMRLQDIAQHLNISDDILNALNSELRFKITPDKVYSLKVPIEMAEKYAGVASEIPRWDKPLPQSSYKGRPVVITHRVRQGETIYTIAKKYRTSAKIIRAQNRLTPRNEALKAGQYLTISISTPKVVLKKTSQEDKSTAGSTVVKYKVKKGDTLALIAERHNVSVADLREMNRLKTNILKSGQIIRVVKNANDSSAGGRRDTEPDKKSIKKKPSVKESASGISDKTKGKTYVVQKGDSLYRIATNHSIKVQRLKELNRLPDTNASLREGQVLLLE
jgi:membrane-bound lytic murein transglycosylase D